MSEENQGYLVEVAVPRLLYANFVYQSKDELAVGVRVEVPLASKSIVGLVVNNQAIEQGDYQVKSVIKIIDSNPIYTRKHLRFLRFIAQYYQYPLGAVIATALPKLLLTGAENKGEEKRVYAITEQGRTALQGSLGNKQRQLLTLLSEHAIDDQTLRQTYGFTASWLDKLLQRNWMSYTNEVSLPELQELPHPMVLTEQQAEIAQQLQNKKSYSVNVLEGVTGSGKTEVYLHWISFLVSTGKQVLLLAPEIAIAILLIKRLREQYHIEALLYHSDLTERVKLNTWHAISVGNAKVLIGTRSALFCQFDNLGAIIVDECHDQAYKQQNGLRYHARDMAIVQGKICNIPVLLGSATPSLESYANIEKGFWKKYQLTERVKTKHKAKITLDDMRTAETVDGLSKGLILQIRRCINEKRQAMLFLNRRGYAPILQCQDCGWQAQCSACDAYLTAHLDVRQLICHHCGRQEKMPIVCPQCHQTELIMVGLGTQKLEQTVAKHFPQANILRIDSDNINTAKQFQQAIARIKDNEIDIIIGTQWLSKGHHFKNLHLVAVIDADHALYSSDFRAEERLAQLLVQVGGRAGRENSGHIWIQTKQVTHPVFEALSKPYQFTAKRILAQRQLAQLPPYSAQVIIYAQHKDLARVLLALDYTQQGFTSAFPEVDWQFLGPIPSIIAKKNHLYKAHLLIQGANKKAIQQSLPDINAWLLAQGKALNVRVGIDVDPLFFD